MSHFLVFGNHMFFDQRLADSYDSCLSHSRRPFGEGFPHPVLLGEGSEDGCNADCADLIRFLLPIDERLGGHVTQDYSMPGRIT